MKCPQCHFENPGNAKFCMECGHSLKTPAPYSPIDFTKPHSYTPKFLADKILTTRSAMEGERKRVTVLFADVAGFTSMSEKLDPEQVHQIMDGCFKILMDEIHKYEGTINQFTGDGVMALFGAPLALENHAQNACQAALSIQNSINKYREDLRNKFRVEFQMRIGINSGPVIVGSIGDDLRMDYTAIGDTTNLASRMESLAEPGMILVSSNTYKRASRNFAFKSIGKVAVKGKQELQDAYALVDRITRPGAGMDRHIFSDMVGRIEELNRLELQVSKVIDGHGSIVNVIGEAGIGKSRLLAELRNSNLMKRVVCLEGKAVSIGKNLSFHPVINLLKHWARIKDGDTSTTAVNKLETVIRSVCQKDTDEIFPFVATLMGMKLSGRHAERVKGIEGEALEKLIFKNMRDLLIKSTEVTPLVIVVEDLHWADTSSMELLESLFRLAETRRILFINLLRPNHPETSDRIIAIIKEKLPVYYIEIRLKPLNSQMSESLIMNMLNIKGLQRSIVDQIIQRSGGNPFFIEEVVRSFIDEGAVFKQNGEFRITEKIEKMTIPYTINDVLMARIDRLDENTRELIKVASVIGRSFFYRILTEVANTIDHIDSRLSYLKQTELIRERKRLEELEYLFKHALAQEAAYESILYQKRKEIHLKVAESIEKVFHEKLHEFYGLLALHYTNAERPEKAEEYLIKAGEEALKSSASAEALVYFQDALKSFGKRDVDPDKMAMLEKNIAYALFNRGRTKESIEHFTKVLNYYNHKEIKNSLFGILKLALFISQIFLCLYIPFFRWRKVAGNKENEMFPMMMKKSMGLYTIDLKKFLIETINVTRFAITYDTSAIESGASYFVGFSSIFYVSGNYRLSRKVLDIGKQKIKNDDIRSKLFYEMNNVLLTWLTGEKQQYIEYDIDLVNQNIRIAEYWNIAAYILYHNHFYIEQGDIQKVEELVNKAHEIAENYEYDFAMELQFISRTKFLMKYRKLDEGLIAVKKGIEFISNTGSVVYLQILYSINSRICLIAGDTEEAKKLLLKAEKVFTEKKIYSMHKNIYALSRFAFNIKHLEELIRANDKSEIDKAMKQTLRSGKNAVRISKKVIYDGVETCRLMGVYYWLIAKQKKALFWWNKSIKEGERIGAHLELSRSYFEVGKRLLEPSSKFTALNNIKAREYLEKAKNMFEEMDLQWDLDELDKVMTAM